jgi:glutamate racemase
LATPATVRGPYLRELARVHAPDCVLFTHGAVRLAGLAEDRFAGRAVEVAAIAADLAGLMVQPGADGIDVVALGCTHYAWLLPELRAVLPRAVTWLDPAPAVARQVARIAAFSPAGTRDGAFDGLVLRTGGETGGLVGPGWGAAGFTRAAGLLS